MIKIIKNNKKILINALKFTLIMIPISIVAGIFTAICSFDSYTPDMQASLIEQLGSKSMFTVVMIVQCIAYAVVCGFLGYIIADKVGLIKPFKVQKAPVIKTLIFGAVGGLAIVGVDYFVFAKFIPIVAESYEVVGFTGKSFIYNIISSVTYGGIVEELMMRWFCMSLVSLIIWKVFFRKYDKENIPTGVFVFANILCSLLFAAGHIPATIVAFGGITAMILIRCFVMNGAAGLIFGYLYRKHGIQYAMLAHIMFHIFTKLAMLLIL